jgi:hypothetical protein
MANKRFDDDKNQLLLDEGGDGFNLNVDDLM